MVFTDVDARDLTTRLKVFGELSLIGAEVDVLDEDTTLIGVLCSGSISVLAGVTVGSGELAFLFLTCSYKALEIVIHYWFEALTLFELLLKLLKLFFLLCKFIIVQGHLLGELNVSSFGVH